MPIVNFGPVGVGEQAESAKVLVEHGLRIPVAIELHPDDVAKWRAAGRHVPEPVRGEALIDTGTSETLVEIAVMERLGLEPTHERLGGGFGGDVRPRKCFMVKSSSPELGLPGIDGVGMIADTLHDDLVALVGRDMLSKMVLVYNGPGGYFTLGF